MRDAAVDANLVQHSAGRLVDDSLGEYDGMDLAHGMTFPLQPKTAAGTPIDVLIVEEDHYALRRHQQIRRIPASASRKGSDGGEELRTV